MRRPGVLKFRQMTQAEQQRIRDYVMTVGILVVLGSLLVLCVVTLIDGI